MDHIVCLDAGALELENLVSGHKSMILRGEDIIQLPYGSVKDGDILYFVNNLFESEVLAKGKVTSVFNSGRLSVEESFETIIRNQDKLQLPDRQFERMAGKRYLVLIGVSMIEKIEPFRVDKAIFLISDDWASVADINAVVVNSEDFKYFK